MARHNSANHIGYVLGYGSLVCEESRKGTLGYNQHGCTIARIGGLKRSFSATSLGNSMYNYKYFTQGVCGQGFDLVPAFMPTFLNVEIDLESTCLGVLIPVNSDGLQAFDAREGNYNRVDITHLMSQEERDALPYDDASIYCYMAKSASHTRTTRPEARIPSIYFETCRAAFATFEGGEEDFLSNTKMNVPQIECGLPYYLEKY